MQNSSQVSQMLSDLNKVDFTNVQEQVKANYFHKQYFQNREYEFLTLFIARDFPTYSLQGVLVTNTPLKNLYFVPTSHPFSVEPIDQWQSNRLSFCR